MKNYTKGNLRLSIDKTLFFLVPAVVIAIDSFSITVLWLCFAVAYDKDAE